LPTCNPSFSSFFLTPFFPSLCLLFPFQTQKQQNKTKQNKTNKDCKKFLLEFSLPTSPLFFLRPLVFFVFLYFYVSPFPFSVFSLLKLTLDLLVKKTKKKFTKTNRKTEKKRKKKDCVLRFFDCVSFFLSVLLSAWAYRRCHLFF